MTKLTPDEAKGFKCPVARTFPEKVGDGCDANKCILWRWVPVSSGDPTFISAVKREEACLAQEAGKGKPAASYHAKAVANVGKNPSGFGLDPSYGYCGLGGQP